MSGLSYGAALVLAAVFGWAAVAKFRSPAATAEGFGGLGLPAPRVLARLVPAGELVLSGALVTVPAWGAATAIALLAAFTTVLVMNQRRPGLGPGCNCFGASPTDDAVSWVEIVRNLLLAAAAVIATGAARPELPALPEAVVVTTSVLLAAVLLGVLRLRHHVGAVWDNRLPGEPVEG